MNAKEREYFEKDICRYYRGLVGAQKNRIEIIAELNGKSKEEITEILVRGGEISLKKKKSKIIKQYPKGFEEFVDRVDRGEITGAEAAKHLGIPASQFSYYKGRLHSERKEDEQIRAAERAAAG